MTLNHSSSSLWNDNRNENTDFKLIEVDRANMVDPIRSDDSDGSEGVFAMGEMREVCPQCSTNHLKLVLRQKRVRHAHLFCEFCDKCFDAHRPDGSSALEIAE